MLKEGMQAPNFNAMAQDGKMVQLSSYTGKIALYFYPKDDTPGCTKEACGFRDAFLQYKQAGITIIGVSPDDTESHKKFIKKYDLPFTLVSDTDHAIAMQYDVWTQKSMFGKKYMGVNRTTFLIEGGKIKKIFENVDVEGHAQQISEAFA